MIAKKKKKTKKPTPLQAVEQMKTTFPTAILM